MIDARPKPLRDFALAVSLLTALPLDVRRPAEERPDVAGYFPLVGLGLGVLAAAPLLAVDLFASQGRAYLQGRAAVLGVLVVAAWALATRMLHWDALADVADAYWGSDDPALRLAIMADSRTGAFGATAVALVALVQVSAAATLIWRGEMLVFLAVPLLGRLAATFGAWLGRAAKPVGLGASVVRRPSAASLLVCAVCVLALVATVTIPDPVGGAAVAVIALITAAAVPHLLASRFGGVTGDVLGASVLLTEAIAFVLFVLVC